MISLILPYWQRQQAAVAGLESLARHYAGLDLEVIVVDDGSPDPFVVPPLPIRIRLLRLPSKATTMSPCVPINRGVSLATGDIIALSSVEMLHISPVLSEMRDELLRVGSLGYVSAAVWAPESHCWHVHTSLGRPPLNFMTMMHRSLWDASGGFDEDYREGMAFEDDDFLNRLKRVGARFVIRDDLVIHHPRKGAKAKYEPEQHARNRLLFAKKWAGNNGKEIAHR